MGLFSIFNNNKSEKIKEALKEGALIIDVRTPQEFNTGHVKGARNIPVDKIAQQTKSIKKQNKPVIVYCASGMRSARAAGILSNSDITCYNGGGIGKMRSYLNGN